MLVLTGRIISASRQSFSSHGCWATMHSIFGLLKGFYCLIAIIPAGSPAGGIGPYHMYFSAALFFGYGIGVFYELVFNLTRMDPGPQ